MCASLYPLCTKIKGIERREKAEGEWGGGSGWGLKEKEKRKRVKYGPY